MEMVEVESGVIVWAGWTSCGAVLLFDFVLKRGRASKRRAVLLRVRAASIAMCELLSTVAILLPERHRVGERGVGEQDRRRRERLRSSPSSTGVFSGFYQRRALSTPTMPSWWPGSSRSATVACFFCNSDLPLLPPQPPNAAAKGKGRAIDGAVAVGSPNDFWCGVCGSWNRRNEVRSLVGRLEGSANTSTSAARRDCLRRTCSKGSRAKQGLVRQAR